ncbi:MAG: DUF5615 family PIN-like protein [Phycisphaerae bacterium]
MFHAVKLVEDLSPKVAEPLERSGYQVNTVVGQGWSGLKDDEIWTRVMAEGVFFITADKGFGDIRVFTPGTHAGILLLRPDRESIVEFQTLLATLLAGQRLESLEGAVTVMTPRGIRVRRPISS